MLEQTLFEVSEVREASEVVSEGVLQSRDVVSHDRNLELGLLVSDAPKQVHRVLVPARTLRVEREDGPSVVRPVPQDGVVVQVSVVAKPREK